MDPIKYDEAIQAAKAAGLLAAATTLEQERDKARTSIEVHILRGQVVLAFGDRVSSIGMTPSLAREIAGGLYQAAAMLDRPRQARHRHKKK